MLPWLAVVNLQKCHTQISYAHMIRIQLRVDPNANRCYKLLDIYRSQLPFQLTNRELKKKKIKKYDENGWIHLHSGLPLPLSLSFSWWLWLWFNAIAFVCMFEMMSDISMKQHTNGRTVLLRLIYFIYFNNKWHCSNTYEWIWDNILIILLFTLSTLLTFHKWNTWSYQRCCLSR